MRFRNLFKRTLAGAAVTVGSVAAAVLSSTSANAATFDDGTFVVAGAHFSSCAQTVSVIPTTNEPLDGNFSVYAIAWVYDAKSGGWLSTPDWTLADGITTLTFSGVTAPDPTAYVEYGHYVNGTWVTAWDTVQITNDLDNAFC